MRTLGSRSEQYGQSIAYGIAAPAGCAPHGGRRDQGQGGMANRTGEHAERGLVDGQFLHLLAQCRATACERAHSRQLP